MNLTVEAQVRARTVVSWEMERRITTGGRQRTAEAHRDAVLDRMSFGELRELSRTLDDLRFELGQRMSAWSHDMPPRDHVVRHGSMTSEGLVTR